MMEGAGVGVKVGIGVRVGKGVIVGRGFVGVGVSGTIVGDRLGVMLGVTSVAGLISKRCPSNTSVVVGAKPLF